MHHTFMKYGENSISSLMRLQYRHLSAAYTSEAAAWIECENMVTTTAPTQQAGPVEMFHLRQLVFIR